MKSKVTKEMLDRLLPPKEQTPAPSSTYTPQAGSFNAHEFISKHMQAERVTKTTRGEKHVLSHCPFNDDHKAPDAAVFVDTDGKLGFKCLHNSCSSKTWKDVRLLFEPDAYSKRETENYPTVDLSKFQAHHVVDDLRNEKPAPYDFNVPGFVSEMMADTLRTAPYPNQALAFVGALTLQSCLCGRKVRDTGNIYTNIYAVALANSGTGKDHPRRRNASVLQAVKQLNCLGDGIASGQGLEDFMFLNPNALLQMDEFDSLLAAVNRPGDSIAANLNATLLKFYSSSASVYPLRIKAGDEERRQITNPHLTLFATATPQGFMDNLTAKNIKSGLVPRMIILEAGRRGQGQDAAHAGVSFYLTSAAQEWLQPGEDDGNLAEINPQPIVVERNPDAQKILQDATRLADSEWDRYHDAGVSLGCDIWSRVVENAKKLALLHACSEMGKRAEITRPAAEWAVTFAMRQAKWLLDQLDRLGGDSDFEMKAQRFLEKLRKSGGGEKRSTMLHYMKCEKQEFDKLVATLIERDEITVGQTKTSGRPGVVYLLSLSSPFLPQ